MNFPLPDIFTLKTPEYISVPEYNSVIKMHVDKDELNFQLLKQDFSKPVYINQICSIIQRG